MKTKIVFQLVVIVALVVLGTGCATQSFVDKCHERTVDLFSPSAVFLSTNTYNFALEGTYSNRPPTTYMATPSLHGYVIISGKELAAHHFGTNGNLSLNEIQKFPAELTRNLKTRHKLPSDFEKIVSLPTNNIGFEVNERYPPKWVYVFIPMPVVFDIATSPIQIPWYLLIGWAMANSHGC
jgi:hypothetical protein